MNTQSASFFSSDRSMCKGFDWAQREAARHIAPDVPAGPCYEAALPGRAAFCMRDTAHQVLGAQVLGLSAYNWNMLLQFAQAADERRDFCSFWEICFDGTPCPVDYTSDADFWYNLPANFDVLDACFRAFQWTGDTRYLNDPRMDFFYRVTTDDYVRRWDRDHNGTPDRVISDGRRGIATYDESKRNQGYVEAADLLSTQFAAYQAYAGILGLNGDPQAEAFRQMAAALRARFENGWWNEAAGRYESVAFPDGSHGGEFIGMDAIMPLYTGMLQDPVRRKAQAHFLYGQDDNLCMEERTYVPETLWLAGEDEMAQAVWLRETATGYDRREYPEVSFTAIGAVASGYMGIWPDAGLRMVSTHSALLGAEWAELSSLPLWGGNISVYHEGRLASTLENKTGGVLTWRCSFGDGSEKTVSIPAGETARLAQ